MERSIEGREDVAGNESGAALVTVLLITFLLVTASAAMLSAAGASARNATDVLSETKAYYAAESGIQAAVNALRFGGDSGGPVNYKEAVNFFANSGDLQTWLPAYDATCNGPARVRIANECDNAYSITVSDPDNSQSSIGFRTTSANFRVVNTDGTFGPWGTHREYTPTAGGASEWPTRGTRITWTPNADNPKYLAFSAGTPDVTTPIGAFTVSFGSAGPGVPDLVTEFRVFYQLELPGSPGWLISGKISTSGAVTLLSSQYVVSGSGIEICGNNVNGCSINLALAGENAVTAKIEPREPTRLLVKATGYGPNRASKVLEAVLQKTPLDNANSVSPFTMLGPCGAVFDAGRSNTVTYTGASSGGVNAPAFAFTSECNLTTANTHIARHLTPNPNSPNPPQVSPPPAHFETSQLPEWQRSPQQLDAKIQLYRAQAQYTGTYYNPASSKITNPGYIAGQTGPMTGVTFCEGDCIVEGNLGGGILVVTGSLQSLGGFSFKGLILVTGPNGWERAGGGCGTIVGNVVIAPYTAAHLTNNVFVLPPTYEITGGGCSGIEYAGLDDLFEGENSAMTNFIRGVAEK